MTKHDDHHHHHKHGHHNPPPDKPPESKGLHKDWRLWVIVVLMLAAITAYIASMDESLWPGGGGEPVPGDTTGE